MLYIQISLHIPSSCINSLFIFYILFTKSVLQIWIFGHRHLKGVNYLKVWDIHLMLFMFQGIMHFTLYNFLIHFHICIDAEFPFFYIILEQPPSHSKCTAAFRLRLLKTDSCIFFLLPCYFQECSFVLYTLSMRAKCEVLNRAFPFWVLSFLWGTLCVDTGWKYLIYAIRCWASSEVRQMYAWEGEASL